MKLNTDKCHLLVSGHKFEEIWMKVGKDQIWEEKKVRLLGITIDNELKFDQHITEICLKANKKLSILSRMSKFLSFDQRRIIYKAFVESQFKYCPLVWFFHSRTSNNKINKLHERALRLVYDDYESSFESLLEKDGSFCIHHQNLQKLALEIYKVIHNNSTGDFKNLFNLRNCHNNRSGSELLIPSVNSVMKGQNSLRYLGPLIWNLIPIEIRNLDSFDAFKSEIKNWKPVNCPCRLCKSFMAGVGFINISD